MNMSEFLAAVDAGTTGFRSDGLSGNDIETFRQTVDVALEAFRADYIGAVQLHEPGHINRPCDSIRVTGITPTGRAWLRGHPGRGNPA